MPFRPRTVGLACLALLATAGWTFARAEQEARPSVRPESELERIEIEVGDLVFQGACRRPRGRRPRAPPARIPADVYSYRHQIRALAAAGYRAVAPDQRGYSPGARPLADEDYAMAHLVGDVVGIADALGRPSFHLVGHDWGGAVAWVVAARHAERVLSLTVCSTPHYAALGESWSDPESEQTRRSGYMKGFRADGAELSFVENDAARLRGIFRGAGLSEDEIQVYVDALGTPDAMRAALAWYRAMGSSSRPPSTSPAGAAAAGSNSGRGIRPRTLYVWSTGDPAFARAPASAPPTSSTVPTASRCWRRWATGSPRRPPSA